MHPAFAALYEYKDMIEIMKQCGLGPDIAAHPVWNVRSKIPNHGETTVPWHQDNSYVPPDTWHEDVMSAWFPLIKCDKDNGCMQYIKGAHLSGKTARHTICEGNTWYTELTDDEISKTLLDGKNVKENTVTVPCDIGDVIIFGGTNPHRSLPNGSDHVRWSLDYRYHSVDPAIGIENYNYFYGLKESLLLYKHNDRNFKPNWESWESNRQIKEHVKDVSDEIITGPWMDLWDITAPTNKHIETYMRHKGLWKDEMRNA